MDQSVERKRIQEEKQLMIYTLIRVLKLQLEQVDKPTRTMKLNAILVLKSGVMLDEEQMGVLSEVFDADALAECASEVRDCILNSNSKLNPKRVDINGRIVEDIFY